MAFTITNPVNTDGASAVPGADNRALGLQLYSNMVIEAFDRKNIGRQFVDFKQITSGTSYQYIIAGDFTDTDVATHTPGADVSTSVLKYDEVDVKIGDKLYISTLVDKLDEKLSHFDHRASLAKQRASALSDNLDKAIFTAIDGALDVVTPKAGQIVSTTTVEATIATATTQAELGDALLNGIFKLAGEMNAANVPTDDRYFVTTAANYNALVLSQKGVNRDFNGDNGSVASGNIMQIAGVKITWSNNLPTRLNCEGYMVIPEAVGLVMAMDVESESNYIPEKLSWLLTDIMAYGMGVLDTGKIGALFKA